MLRPVRLLPQGRHHQVRHRPCGTVRTLAGSAPRRADWGGVSACAGSGVWGRQRARGKSDEAAVAVPSTYF